MRARNFGIAAGALALGLATFVTPGNAQGPMYDTVFVNIPYSVTFGDKTLQPGDYVVKELETPTKSRILNIYSDDGRTFEGSAITIPAYQIVPPDETSVVLHHFGNDYYFDRVWIQGKNYGYEFPLPSSVKQRERERLGAVSLAARWEAEATPTQPAPQAGVEVQPAPQPEVSQAPPPEAPAPPPQVAQAPPPEAQPALPRTSADWLMMLLSGGSFSAAGLMLRRKLSRS